VKTENRKSRLGGKKTGLNKYILYKAIKKKDLKVIGKWGTEVQIGLT
jgi:hypothetical protein